MEHQRTHRNTKGFTLIELLIVVGILGILMAITIVALNPVKHFQDARNAQRQADVTSILDGIYEYEASNRGQLPAALQGITPSTIYDIRNTATAGNKVDLCSALVPNFMADLPLDPGPTNGGSKSPSTAICTAATSYATAYTISQSSSGTRFTIAAPSAEGGVTVSVTR